MAEFGAADRPKRATSPQRGYLALRSNPPRRRADDDDEWEDDHPHELPIGTASGAAGAPPDDDDEPLGGLHGWIYYPDPTSRTGWSTWDVKRRRADNASPTRAIGFTIPRTTRGDPG